MKKLWVGQLRHSASSPTMEVWFIIWQPQTPTPHWALVNKTTRHFCYNIWKVLYLLYCWFWEHRNHKRETVCVRALLIALRISDSASSCGLFHKSG